MYSDDEEYTPNYLKLPTSLLEEEELNVDKENLTLSRGKKDRSKGLTGIQERSSIPDMQQSIAMPTCSTSSSNPDLHSLPMPTRSTRSSNSDLHSLHMPTCSTRSNPELHSVAMPTCSSSAVALKQTLGENSLSLSKLGKIVRQFDLGVEDEEYLKSAMANNNIKINMDHIKKLQSNIDGLQTSSDSVVRSLTAVVREQANVIAGMSLTAERTGKGNEEDFIPHGEK
ncbi:unnamed protein product [Cylicocyclus nassatus]|uniref:Uncharacterized protein n=1 Tax=Cylicocyclus nassatus TaxID=53992 RepID=A0AA36M889_CYLNA|nr:unnamed protein product [Cylicocyclus nassatus]